jgi:D-lactate dehydrogenase
LKTLFFSTKNFEKPYLDKSGKDFHDLNFIPEALTEQTASKATGYEAVSIFAGDDASAPVLNKLKEAGIGYIAIRAAGYDNTNIAKANELKISVANVPAYSPYAIAEHAVALILALNRKLMLAKSQVTDYNFTTGNLVGFDLHRKTVGIIGTGTIGSIFAGIMHGFGCKLIGYDIIENPSLIKKYQLEYHTLETLCRESDIISIHTCLNESTHHMINRETISFMKPSVMIINTSRGGCVNTTDVIDAIENKKIGFFGTDVYEKERGVFFYDYSGKELSDPILKKLLQLPNVLVTPHQAFATHEALTNIADTTFHNLRCWINQQRSENELTRF